MSKPQFIDDIEQRVACALVRLGVSAEVAGMVSAELSADIVHAWSGERVYIAATEYKRARLNQEVRRRFNGRNAHELARELGVGRATVYRVVKTSGR